MELAVSCLRKFDFFRLHLAAEDVFCALRYFLSYNLFHFFAKSLLRLQQSRRRHPLTCKSTVESLHIQTLEKETEYCRNVLSLIKICSSLPNLLWKEFQNCSYWSHIIYNGWGLMLIFWTSNILGTFYLRILCLWQYLSIECLNKKINVVTYL